jgi:hypothetical protein
MLAGDLVRLRPLDVADAEAHWRWNNPGVREGWFVVEGRARDTIRQAGEWHDMVLMSLLEGELS